MKIETSFLSTRAKKLSNPIGLLNFLSKPTKEAWYVIATESRMASRRACIFVGLITYIPSE